MAQKVYTPHHATLIPIPVDQYIPYPPHSGQDWSAIELAMVAVESGDAVLHNAYNRESPCDQIQFKVAEPISSITQLDIRGKGLGYRPNPPTSLWKLWLWNRVSSVWEELGSHSSNTLAGISATRTGNVGNYVDSNGYLYLASAGPASTPGYASVNSQDYYGVKVTF